MSNYLGLLLTMLAVSASSCCAPQSGSSIQASSPTTNAKIVDCNFDMKDPVLPVVRNDFTQICFQPRGADEPLVHMPKNAASFASRCAVTIGRPIPLPPDYPCRSTGTDVALMEGDHMTVTHWPNGNYTLTRVRNGSADVFPLHNTAGVITDQFGELGFPYLHNFVGRSARSTCHWGG